MNDLLLHPNSKQQLEKFIKQQSHTIALIGAAGTGKGVVATNLAAALLSLAVDKLETYPYFRVYTPDNNTISIDTARAITSFTKLKTAGRNDIRRVIIIEDAQAMTIEAQNALLKTLEEPPADTVFILTIANIANILPTILSRLQTITLRPLAQAAILDYFVSAGHDSQKITQYYHMSSGLPGLIYALLDDNENHPLAHSIQQAKAILQADSFERLVMIDDIVKQKQTAQIIDALNTISRSAMYIEASRENSKDMVLKRWASVLQSCDEAKKLLQQNAQAKLVLTSLFLEI